MESLKRFFNSVSDVLYKFLSVYTVISLTLLFVLIVLQVILRYVFHAPLFGIEEAEIFPILWIYAFGGCLSSFENTHIECGVAGVIVKNPTAIKIIQRIKYIITFGLSLYACSMLFPHFTYILKVRKTTVSMGLPTLFCDGAILIGLIIMSFMALRDLVNDIVPDKKTEEGGIE